MQRLKLWIGSLFAWFGVVPVAWAQGEAGYYGPHMMWGGYYGMLFGPLMMIVFVAVVVALVVLAMRWLGPSHGSPQQSASSTTAPLDVLRERFARGDIDKDEFQERRRVLGE